MQQQYILSDEPLFFVDRLDRFSPLTCKFFSFGADVVTPLTQNELIDIILGNNEQSHTIIKRQLAESHIMAGVRDASSYYNADNNHSGFWESGFVHNIPRPLTFWNLDDDFENVLKEAFDIDHTIAAGLIRSIVFDLLDGESSLVEALQHHPDNAFLHWLDEKSQDLPPKPDKENFNPDEQTKFYDAVDAQIFEPLTHKTELNDAIIELCVEKAKTDDHYKVTTLESHIIHGVFPNNSKADGYIINGFKTLIPNDAMRGAIYVGNVCEILQKHKQGQALLDIENDENPYTLRDEALQHNLYPSKMVNSMASDWITGTRFTKSHPDYSISHGSMEDAFDMSLLPKTEYPQIGELSLLQIGCRRQDVEPDVVVNSPKYDDLLNLRRTMKADTSQKPRLK